MNFKIKFMSFLFFIIYIFLSLPCLGADHAEFSNNLCAHNKYNQNASVDQNFYKLLSEIIIPTAASDDMFRCAQKLRDGNEYFPKDVDRASICYQQIINQVTFYITHILSPNVDRPFIPCALMLRSHMVEYRGTKEENIPIQIDELRIYLEDILAQGYYEYAYLLENTANYIDAKFYYLKAGFYKHPCALLRLAQLFRAGNVSLSFAEQQRIPALTETSLYDLCHNKNWTFPLDRLTFRFRYQLPTMQSFTMMRLLGGGLQTHQLINRATLSCSVIWIRPLKGFEATEFGLDNEDGFGKGIIQTLFLIIGDELIASSTENKPLIIKGGKILSKSPRINPEIFEREKFIKEKRGRHMKQVLSDKLIIR